jgi:uncharacterized protein (DUF2384 family)
MTSATHTPPEPPTIQETAAALEACQRAMELWQLDEDQVAALLGNDDEIQRWAAAPSTVPASVIDRLGDMLRIHSSLKILFADRERAYGWLKHPNVGFGGRRPVDVMLEQGGVAHIEEYLAAEAVLDDVIQQNRRALDELSRR